MASSYQPETSPNDSRDLYEVVSFWKNRWFWGFAAIAVFFFVGGYLISLLGSEPEGFAAGADPYFAMGGIMGSLGLVTVSLWVICIALSIWFGLQREFSQQTDF